MRNIIGKPVCGVDFFGRDGELQELKHISTEEHVLLLATRRVGKTSLLCALASEVERDESATGTYVSVAASASEPQFVKTVLEERLRSALGAPDDAFARVLLDRCARTVAGSSDVSLSLALARQLPDLEERGKTLRWLLEALVNDGYLVEQSGRWRFRSGLLRRYWRKHVAP